MPNLKEIKTRIKSVKNTGKITKAMELISTVKMRKAQDAVLSSRPFALKALEILTTADDSFFKGPLFEAPEKTQNKELFVLVSSNKGLCGGYNVNLFRGLAKHLEAHRHIEFDFVTLGKKGREFVTRTGANLLADFSKDISDTTKMSEIRPVARLVKEKFLTGEYDKVVVVYNYYESAISQKVMMDSYLSISKEDIFTCLQHIVGDMEKNTESIDYKIEPSLEALVEQIIPFVLDIRLYEMVLEGRASEHASRMVAMKNAKDNAHKKVDALSLEYNKARQGAITKEISELVGGVEALKEA